MLSRQLIEWECLYMHMNVNTSIICISDFPKIEIGMLVLPEDQNINLPAFELSTVISQT